MCKPREVTFSESLLNVRDGRKQINVGDHVELCDIPGKGLRSTDHGDGSAKRVDSRVMDVQRRLARNPRTGERVVITNYTLVVEE